MDSPPIGQPLRPLKKSDIGYPKNFRHVAGYSLSVKDEPTDNLTTLQFSKSTENLSSPGAGLSNRSPRNVKRKAPPPPVQMMRSMDSREVTSNDGEFKPKPMIHRPAPPPPTVKPAFERSQTTTALDPDEHRVDVTDTLQKKTLSTTLSLPIILPSRPTSGAICRQDSEDFADDASFPLAPPPTPNTKGDAFPRSNMHSEMNNYVSDDTTIHQEMNYVDTSINAVSLTLALANMESENDLNSIETSAIDTDSVSNIPDTSTVVADLKRNVDNESSTSLMVVDNDVVELRKSSRNVVRLKSIPRDSTFDAFEALDAAILCHSDEVFDEPLDLEPGRKIQEDSHIGAPLKSEQNFGTGNTVRDAAFVEKSVVADDFQKLCPTPAPRRLISANHTKEPEMSAVEESPVPSNAETPKPLTRKKPPLINPEIKPNNSETSQTMLSPQVIPNHIVCILETRKQHEIEDSHESDSHEIVQKSDDTLRNILPNCESFITTSRPSDASPISVNQNGIGENATSLHSENQSNTKKDDHEIPKTSEVKDKTESEQRLNWDPKKCFTMNEIEDPKMRLLFENAGVTDEELQDEDTRNFIYHFLLNHGGMEAVTRQAHFKATLRSRNRQFRVHKREGHVAKNTRDTYL